MKVLVACEESQAVTCQLRALGVEAYSCDIIPCSGGHPEWHIKDDVLKYINGDNATFWTMDNTGHITPKKWDMVIAFPPCTHLASSGARWFEQKRKDGRQQAGIKFFLAFTTLNCEHIAIENPIGIMSEIYRKPTQIIQPYYFGDPFEKRTCLWLKGLPELQKTNVVIPPKRKVYSSGKTMPEWYSNAHGDRAKVRSKTFPGVAEAMAVQWVDFLHGEGTV